MALIDEANILVQSGSGGNGCVSFRREKYIPFGGPNGGNGGAGGSVYLVASRDKASLLDFKYRPKYLAKRGEHGMGKDMYGRAGEDLTLVVPVGTIVTDAETGDPLVDLSEENVPFLLARGGKGGRGNLSFVTSTNRAPRTATPGETGEIKKLHLELRLLADVGLVGLPNAGKSSFLRAISRARPRVADFPFTTLQPHLGVVESKGFSFVVADLPGLIEGASDGAGLGHRFLKHVTRNRVLLHLVELDPVETLPERVRTIEEELRKFDESLMERQRHLVFTKADLLDPAALEAVQKQLRRKKMKGFYISSATGLGISELLDFIAARLQVAEIAPESREPDSQCAESNA